MTFKILITGADGFIAKNLISKLNYIKNIQVLKYSRKNNVADLKKMLFEADALIHLAGENRPDDIESFERSNVELTDVICKLLLSFKKNIPILFTSSIQINKKNPYGISKLKAEKLLKLLNKKNANPLLIYRLPGVFGKWCKPFYNSVVATFCYQISRNIPINISDPKKIISIVYIDDVIESFITNLLKSNPKNINFVDIKPLYKLSLKKLSLSIKLIKNSRENQLVNKTEKGFFGALYSTYISFIPPSSFNYSIPGNIDERGVFVEFLKTTNSGQFSFFTSKPGVIRGNHFHHSKTEKFIVLSGRAKFRFYNILTLEKYEFIASENKLQVIQTVPGWSHDITNIGKKTLRVIVWSNEIFNKNKPDTYAINFKENL